MFYFTLPETSAFWNLAALNEGEKNRHFKINPKIPLPIESEEHETEQQVLANITLERVLSGMIKTLAGNPSCRYLHYYRRFVRACKPNILRELTSAALVKAEKGDFAFAVEIAAALVAIFPKSAKALYVRALVLEEYAASLRKSGSINEALDAEEKTAAAYREALLPDEPLTAALFSAALFYYKQKQYALSLEHLNKFIPLADNAEQKEAALSLVRQIEGEHLDDIRFARARECIENGREEEGISAIQEFLADNGEVWNAHFLLGLGLRHLKRWEEALTAFTKARELGGGIADTDNEIAICLIELGRPLEAKLELETALVKDGENIKILSNLGIVELKLGNAEKAAAFFRAVLEFAPNDPIAAHYVYNNA
ncbi:MAG: tetratricopeptide repeat protein [Spirochaetaceae bacterium]|jgi:tetratricopeptide (TPR) repeat protein|nr:tetratricopeptide repeat protein [Spirochaetaceae bacterium]